MIGKAGDYGENPLLFALSVDRRARCAVGRRNGMSGPKNHPGCPIVSRTLLLFGYALHASSLVVLYGTLASIRTYKKYYLYIELEKYYVPVVVPSGV